MQGREKCPVVRQIFTTLIRLLPSSAFLRAGLAQFVFKTGPSWIKRRQNSATKLAEGVTELLIFPHFETDQEKDKAITESAPVNHFIT